MPRKSPVRVLSHDVVTNVIETGEATLLISGDADIKAVFDLPGVSAFGIASLSDEANSVQTRVIVKWTKVAGDTSALTLAKGEKFIGVVQIDDPMSISRVPYLITTIK